MTAADGGDALARAAGLTVEQVGPGRFRVTGGSEPHVVDVTYAVAYCDCPDRRYRHRICKHLSAVDHYRAASDVRG